MREENKIDRLRGKSEEQGEKYWQNTPEYHTLDTLHHFEPDDGMRRED